MLLRLATRSSPLAVWQAERVAQLLRSAHRGLRTELVKVSTTGDRQMSKPVWEIGGQGIFVREVQTAVVEGGADVAVHSAKDLQPVESPGLVLAAVPERADARDALVGSRLEDLAAGATVATGSQRRRAQLAAARPDLRFESLRGNIATRLGRVPPGGAIVVAMAALQRLGLEPKPLEVLGTDVMLPQVAQGALAVECREGDARAREVLAAIDDPDVRAAVVAERAFLARLGGGCDLPVAAHARPGPVGRLVVEGLVARTDGSLVVRRSTEGQGKEAAALGRALADSVMRAGGQRLVAEAKAARP